MQRMTGRRCMLAVVLSGALAGTVQADSGKATLVVSTDAPCTLKIDGKQIANLPAGDIQTVTIAGGKLILECISTEEASVKFRAIQEVDPGAKEVTEIALASQVAKAKSEHGRDAARQELERRYADRGETVLDTQTGLEWTKADHGSDIHWNGAWKWCADKGGGWRLPSVDELLSLYDKTETLENNCWGGRRCNVSASFRLTGPWFWSADREDSSRAWYVYLNYGSPNVHDVGNFINGRALCVRRS